MSPGGFASRKGPGTLALLIRAALPGRPRRSSFQNSFGRPRSCGKLWYGVGSRQIPRKLVDDEVRLMVERNDTTKFIE
eukprot:373089-Rhodomonas_salina.2